ncbi:hypothetical protein SAMN05216436_115126 [bacterium A37T11]|nr:hypothetical protein SAMN05216436_115126 [bacterium A37T11]
MIQRTLATKITQLLEEFPAVGLLGPRQIGKTTLAEHLMATLGEQSVYLDLENPSDLAKLQQPEAYSKHKTGFGSVGASPIVF